MVVAPRDATPPVALVGSASLVRVRCGYVDAGGDTGVAGCFRRRLRPPTSRRLDAPQTRRAPPQSASR